MVVEISQSGHQRQKYWHREEPSVAIAPQPFPIAFRMREKFLSLERRLRLQKFFSILCVAYKSVNSSANVLCLCEVPRERNEGFGAGTMAARDAAGRPGGTPGSFARAAIGAGGFGKMVPTVGRGATQSTPRRIASSCISSAAHRAEHGPTANVCGRRAIGRGAGFGAEKRVGCGGVW